MASKLEEAAEAWDSQADLDEEPDMVKRNFREYWRSIEHGSPEAGFKAGARWLLEQAKAKASQYEERDFVEELEELCK